MVLCHNNEIKENIPLIILMATLDVFYIKKQPRYASVNARVLKARGLENRKLLWFSGLRATIKSCFLTSSHLLFLPSTEPFPLSPWLSWFVSL